MHFVHDFGPGVPEVGFQSDHEPIKVEPADYPYRIYHLTFASLGPSILNCLDVSCREYMPGVSYPAGIKVRSVPSDISLISPRTQSDVPADEKLPLPVLNWQF